MSTLKADTIQSTGGAAATLTGQVAAKMWVGWYFNSGTPEVNGSFNISSITDVGTGDADHNLTNAMSNKHVSITQGYNHATTGNCVVDRSAASRFGQRLFNNSGNAEDGGGGFNATIHGDLA